MSTRTSHGGKTTANWLGNQALEIRSDVTQVTWANLHDWLNIEWVNQDLFRITQPIPGVGENAPFTVYGMWQGIEGAFLPLCVVKSVSASPGEGGEHPGNPWRDGELFVPDETSAGSSRKVHVTGRNVDSPVSVTRGKWDETTRKWKSQGSSKGIHSHSSFG